MSEAVPSNGAHEAAPVITPEVRRRHTRQLIWISASVLAVLTAIDMFDDQRAGTFSPGRLGTEAVTNVVVMVVVVLGMLGLRKTGVRWLRPPVAMTFDRTQRRAAARALRPGGEIDPDHRASTVALARNLRRYRWAPGFFLVVGVVNGWSYVTETGAGRWFYGVCALIGFGFTAYYVLTLRKARAIVEADADATPLR